MFGLMKVFRPNTKTVEEKTAASPSAITKATNINQISNPPEPSKDLDTTLRAHEFLIPW